MQIPELISYRYLLQKAWPIILANAAVPLLGLVDTAVIGNVGSIEDLGAIAFGALIFSFVYWSFGMGPVLLSALCRPCERSMVISQRCLYR